VAVAALAALVARAAWVVAQAVAPVAAGKPLLFLVPSEFDPELAELPGINLAG
jgi:hypothetical protein